MSFGKNIKRGKDISGRDIPIQPYPWVFLQCYENNALQYNEETSSIHECTVELDSRLKYTLTRISDGISPSQFFQKVLKKKERAQAEPKKAKLSRVDINELVRRFIEQDLGSTSATVHDSASPDVSFGSGNMNGMGVPFQLGPPSLTSDKNQSQLQLSSVHKDNPKALIEAPSGKVVTTPSYFQILSTLHRRGATEEAETMDDNIDPVIIEEEELCDCGCAMSLCCHADTVTEELVFNILQTYTTQMKVKNSPIVQPMKPKKNGQSSFSNFIQNNALDQDPSLPLISYDANGQSDTAAFPLVLHSTSMDVEHPHEQVNYSAQTSLEAADTNFPLCIAPPTSSTYLSYLKEQQDPHKLPSISNMNQRYQYLLSETARMEEEADGVYVYETNTSESAINDGYYARFFREIRVLGRGAFGTVFLAEHVLDTVKLGLFAVKRIPVGISNSLLLRALAEVRAVEQQRHMNVIQYYHSWVEYAEINESKIQCVFILMEYCDKGDLSNLTFPNRLCLFHSPLPSTGGNTPEQQWQNLLKFYSKKGCCKELLLIAEIGNATLCDMFPLRYIVSRRDKVRSVPCISTAGPVVEFQQQQQQLHYAYHPRTVYAHLEDLAAYPWLISTEQKDLEGNELQTPLLDESLVWTIFIQLCSGLAHSHSRNLCHRDIKLENVMLRTTVKPAALETNFTAAMQVYKRTLICDFCDKRDSSQYSNTIEYGQCPTCIQQQIYSDSRSDGQPILYNTVECLLASTKQNGHQASKISMCSSTYLSKHVREQSALYLHTGVMPCTDMSDGLTAQERRLRCKLLMKKQSQGVETSPNLAGVTWEYLEDVVLTDFGGASKFNESHRSMGVTGTMQYCAPELLNRNIAIITGKEAILQRYTSEPYNQVPLPCINTHVQDSACDIWALGVLLYTLSFGILPFSPDINCSDIHGYYFTTAASHVHYPVYKYQHDIICPRSLALQHMIQFLLKPNPQSRPSIHEVLSHPLMKLHDITNKLHGVPVVGKSLVLTKQLESLIKK